MGEKKVKPISIIVVFSETLLLTLAVIAVAVAEPIKIDPRPQELRSFKIRDPQVVDRRRCSYTVSIKTSCSSARFTRDAISLAFGDAYSNEVYAPRLDDPSSGTFERCSTDTFKLHGPCGYGVCYLYLRRHGRDGWVPDSVKIYEAATGGATTFYYGTLLPDGVWYGFNQCSRSTASAGGVPISQM